MFSQFFHNSSSHDHDGEFGSSCLGSEACTRALRLHNQYAQLRLACFCPEDFGSTAEEDGEAPGRRAQRAQSAKP